MRGLDNKKDKYPVLVFNEAFKYFDRPEDELDSFFKDMDESKKISIMHEVINSCTSERDQFILTLYFASNATLDDVAKQVGVTSERIRQILHRIYKKIMTGLGSYNTSHSEEGDFIITDDTTVMELYVRKLIDCRIKNALISAYRREMHDYSMQSANYANVRFVKDLINSGDINKVRNIGKKSVKFLTDFFVSKNLL